MRHRRVAGAPPLDPGSGAEPRPGPGVWGGAPVVGRGGEGTSGDGRYVTLYGASGGPGCGAAWRCLPARPHGIAMRLRRVAGAPPLDPGSGAEPRPGPGVWGGAPVVGRGGEGTSGDGRYVTLYGASGGPGCGAAWRCFPARPHGIAMRHRRVAGAPPLDPGSGAEPRPGPGVWGGAPVVGRGGEGTSGDGRYVTLYGASGGPGCGAAWRCFPARPHGIAMRHRRVAGAPPLDPGSGAEPRPGPGVWGGAPVSGRGGEGAARRRRQAPPDTPGSA